MGVRCNAVAIAGGWFARFGGWVCDTTYLSFPRIAYFSDRAVETSEAGASGTLMVKASEVVLVGSGIQLGGPCALVRSVTLEGAIVWETCINHA